MSSYSEKWSAERVPPTRVASSLQLHHSSFVSAASSHERGLPFNDAKRAVSSASLVNSRGRVAAIVPQCACLQESVMCNCFVILPKSRHDIKRRSPPLLFVGVGSKVALAAASEAAPNVPLPAQLDTRVGVHATCFTAECTLQHVKLNCINNCDLSAFGFAVEHAARLVGPQSAGVAYGDGNYRAALLSRSLNDSDDNKQRLARDLRRENRSKLDARRGAKLF